MTPAIHPHHTGARLWVAVLVPLALCACNQHNAFMPGTPEYAAALVSRGYDCGLRVERGRVVAAYGRDDRRRFVSTNQLLAVRSYNAPKECSDTERAGVADALRQLAKR